MLCKDINNRVSIISRPTFHYQAYGHRICSEIELPELVALQSNKLLHNASEKIYIQRSPIALDQPACSNAQNGIQVEADSFFFRVPDVAHYLALNGNTVHIDILPGANQREVRLFLLGTVFGMLLHQRGLLPMHASAVVIEDQCVLFTGQSGAGKSTTAGLLNDLGYPILADDIAVVSFDRQQQAIAWPGFPKLKLWSDAIEAMQQQSADLVRDYFRADKFHLPLNENNFIAQPMPISAIYELSESDSIGEFNNLQGHAAASVLLSNTYRSELLVHQQLLRQQNFKQCVKLARAVQVIRLQRNKDFAHSQQLLQKILTHISSLYLQQA